MAYCHRDVHQPRAWLAVMPTSSLRLTCLSRCLVVLVLAAVAMTTPAQAQPVDFCTDYANGRVVQDQRARQMRCTGWNSHSNFDSHYNWCLSEQRTRVQQVEADWQSRFQTCQFAASGSPAAQAQLNAGASLRSGTYNIETRNSAGAVAFRGTVLMSVTGNTFTGQMQFPCCPGPRVDPMINGRVQNGQVSFVRVCTGQGYPGACQQSFTGRISGNSVSGRFTGTGAGGAPGFAWSMSFVR
jgi:hypothetical protein